MKKNNSFLTLPVCFHSGTDLTVSRNHRIRGHLTIPLLVASLLSSSNSYCCTSCNSELRQAIAESLYTNALAMFSAFIALALIISALAYLSVRNHNVVSGPDHNAASKTADPLPLLAAAMVLGIGIGGAADGIILHQILQWHEMLSNKLPTDTVLQKSVNMFWDGIFQLFTLLAILVGISLLWKVLRRTNVNTSRHLLFGGMLAGWGVFNLVEGTINHQLLEMHNVREATPSKDLWNYGFLLLGILLLLSGWLAVRKSFRAFRNRPS